MIENALVAGFTSVGVDVFLLGPDADAGRRHADALAARRLRRDDLRLAQPVRRQRHQALRPGRLQAVRRGRARDRGADRFGPVATARRRRPISAAPSASTACWTATSSPPSARCRAQIELRGLRIVVDCANGAAYKVAPDGALGARRGSHHARRRARRLQHQPRRRLDRARRRWRARCTRCAPISASRSTATPTASSSSTRRAASSTATS